MSAPSPLQQLWQHIYGDQTGYIGLFAVNRGQEEAGEQSAFYPYPAAARFAEGWLEQQAQRPGRDTYFCAHLLTTKDGGRKKVNAATVGALWADLDGAPIPTGDLAPTAVVQSSPGRFHAYWRLPQPMPAAEAEALNKRLTYFIGADTGGWDLTQLLRPPGLPNRKREIETTVEVVYINDGATVDPDHLDRILPPAPAETRARATGSSRHEGPQDGGTPPPVRLGAWGMEWWTGQRRAANRSDTLWAIGKELGRAGAAEHITAEALAERDQTLPGMQKYTGRPDAATRYAETAARALVEVLKEETAAASAEPAGQGSPDMSADDRVLQLEQQVAHLRRRLAETERQRDELHRIVRAEHAVLANKHLKGMAPVLMAVARETISGQSRESRDDGFVPIYRGAVGDQCGVSDDTVTSQIKRACKYGLVEKKVERVLDEDGGYRNQLLIRLKGATVAEALEHAATFTPDEPPNWGGKRIPACSDCGEGAGVHRYQYGRLTCAGCGQKLVETEQETQPDGTRIARDLLTGRETRHAPPQEPQDAVLHNDEDTEVASCGDGSTRRQDAAFHNVTALERRRRLRQAQPAAQYRAENDHACAVCGGRAEYENAEGLHCPAHALHKTGGLTRPLHERKAVGDD